MEIENGRSLERESKVNGVPEENGKDSVSGITHDQMTAQSEDSTGVGVDNSTTSTFSAPQENSNELLVEDMATAKVKMDANTSKNGGENYSECLADGEREGESGEVERSSKRPRRRASSAAKPKQVEPSLSTPGRV